MGIEFYLYFSALCILYSVQNTHMYAYELLIHIALPRQHLSRHHDSTAESKNKLRKTCAESQKQSTASINPRSTFTQNFNHYCELLFDFPRLTIATYVVEILNEHP